MKPCPSKSAKKVKRPQVMKPQLMWADNAKLPSYCQHISNERCRHPVLVIDASPEGLAELKERMARSAHEYAQNVVMHNDAFEMRKFRFTDPIICWPKWAQANYDYAKAAFLSFAREISPISVLAPKQPRAAGKRRASK